MMTLDGGKRGLLVNSADICAAPAYALARMVGQNNRGAVLRPEVRASCPKRRRGHGRHKHTTKRRLG